MATVTHCGVSYTCTTAIKGADYIRLLDDAGALVASFDGVKDFGVFAIAGGSWTTPKSVDNCNIAVVLEDGSIGKCSSTTGQFLKGGSVFSGNIVLKSGVQYGTSLPSTGVTGQLFFKI